MQSVIKRQTRSSTSLVFQNGDSVYHERDGSYEWKGPGKVIGTDSQTVLIKYGFIHVRVTLVELDIRENCKFSNSASDNS